MGAADSIADMVGTAVGWDLLGAERLVASPVPTGSGRIRIAHGEFSVPAPATAELLRGIPLAASAVAGRADHADRRRHPGHAGRGFGPLPAMTIEQIGYGAGQRDLPEQANVLRLLVGQAADGRRRRRSQDQVCVLETNLDDTSGEVVGYCTRAALGGRGPGRLHDGHPDEEEPARRDAHRALPHGGRRRAWRRCCFARRPRWASVGGRPLRHVLARQAHRVETPWGPVEGKVGWLAGGAARFAPEFESCRQLAARHNLPLREVYEAAQRAFDPSSVREGKSP